MKTLFRNHIRRLLFFCILPDLCNYFLCLSLLGLLFFCVLPDLCNPALVSYGEISKISFLSVLLLPARRFRTEKSPKSRFYPYFCYLHGVFVRRNLQNFIFIRTFATCTTLSYGEISKILFLSVLLLVSLLFHP